MTKQRTHASVRNLPRSFRFIALGAALLLTLMTGGLFFSSAHSNQVKATTSSFSLTAAGDYDSQSAATTAALETIAGSGASFHLTLGDINESTAETPAQWSSAIQNIVGTSFPFEIIPGDHDTGNLSTYVADLPDRMGSTGTYGEQYYFDYPSAAPLVRIIMISPGETPGFSYSKGSAGYNWVANTIDGARCVNIPQCTVIPWVIVGMYENCFSIGSQHCLNDDILNLLVSKNVDLVLYAHKHDYQASKQVAFNGTTCTILTTTYNANCVVNATSSMTQGKGTVIVLTGTGGASQLTISNTDPALPYFRAYNGRGSNTTWGVTQLTISQSKLTEKFVPVKGVKGSGTFTDSFAITAAGSSKMLSSLFSPKITARTTVASTMILSERKKIG